MAEYSICMGVSSFKNPFYLYMGLPYHVVQSLIFWGVPILFSIMLIQIYVLINGMCLVAQSCLTLCDPSDCSLPASSVHGDSPGKNAGVGNHALLQGIFPTRGSNPGRPHYRRILYHLNHQGSLRILEWVAYLFYRGISSPRDWTRVSWIADGFFTSWATWELCKRPVFFKCLPILVALSFG